MKLKYLLFFLGLAKRVRCPILLASTSEVYGDPEIHPQPETYWGHVNPVGKFFCKNFEQIRFLTKCMGNGKCMFDGVSVKWGKNRNLSSSRTACVLRRRKTSG